MLSLLQTSLAIYMDAVRNANQSNLPTLQEINEDPEEKAALAEVMAQLPEVMKETKLLKESLQEGGLMTKRGRHRKEGDQPGEKQPKMRDAQYIQELVEFLNKDNFKFTDFVARICGGQPYPFPLDHAWKSALAGLTPVTSLAAMEKIVNRYLKFDDPDTMLSLVKEATSISIDANGLASAYNIVKHESVFTAAGTHPWLQHMCGAAVHLHFGLSWRSLGSGEEGKKRKKGAREKLYKPTGPMTQEERASDAYTAWMNKFDVKRTACTRMVEVYELLGSIVVLHPGFAFSIFRDSRHCPGIGELLEELRPLIEEDGMGTIWDNERTHRRLVQMVVQCMCAEDNTGKIPLLELFETIEGAVDRSFIGVLPEDF